MKWTWSTGEKNGRGLCVHRYTNSVSRLSVHGAAVEKSIENFRDIDRIISVKYENDPIGQNRLD